ncbi:MAG: polyprenyl synthetase family protein [Calditrichaeota bacterium]|nr:polyprenyl synthetase family protein [Calditrichota bacterium]
MTEFEKKLTHLRTLVNTRIQSVFEHKEPAILYEPMKYIIDGGGKRLRPVLLLLSSEAVGGRAEDCLDAAVAVEMLHNFTLIHDDVMDQDDIRRGQETVHKKWDVNVAILSGDGLVALSYRYLMNCAHPRIAEIGKLFSDALRELCEGQALDKEFESRWNVTLSDYFTMIRKKTAVLIALCTQIGGIFGNGSEEHIRSLWEYGLNMGMAFQIQDDLLDVTADEKVLGKDWGSDILQRKKTFLLIHALEVGSPATKREIHSILDRPAIDVEGVKRVAELFQETGTLQAAETCIQDHFQKAQEQLSVLPETRGRKNLELFLELVSHRNY